MRILTIVWGLIFMLMSLFVCISWHPEWVIPGDRIIGVYIEFLVIGFPFGLVFGLLINPKYIPSEKERSWSILLLLFIFIVIIWGLAYFSFSGRL
jgi:hypothetical protein